MTPGDGEDVVPSVEPTAKSSQKHTKAASEKVAKPKLGKKDKTTEKHAATEDEPDTIALKTPADQLLDLSASLSLNSGPLPRMNTDTQQMHFTMQTPAPEGHATPPDCLSGHRLPQPQQSAQYQQSGRMHHPHVDAHNTDLRINSTNRDAALFSDRNVGFEDGSAYLHTNQDVTQSPAEHRTAIQSSYPPLQQHESNTGPYYTDVTMQDTLGPRPVDGSFSDMYGTLGGTDDGNNSPNPFANPFDDSDYLK